MYNQIIPSAYNELENYFSEIISLEIALEHKQHQAKEIYQNETHPALTSIMSLLSQVKDHISKHEHMLEEKMTHEASIAISAIVYISLIAIVFGIAISFILIRLITRPLIKTENFTNKLAKGDFSQTLDIDQTNEIGNMVKSINEMAVSLKSALKEISDGANSLDESATSLSDISTQMTSNSKETEDRSHNVASAAEEMAKTMNSVAAASEQATVNIQNIASAIEEMSATINEISTNTSKGNQTTAEAVEKSKFVSDKMNVLNQAALGIQEVNDNVNQISGVAGEVTQDIQQVNQSAAEVSSGSLQVHNSAVELSNLSTQLNELTDEFKFD